jgi:hypothetical protein
MSTRSPKKSKKIPPAVLIALIGLIGTLITALLSSPVIIKLLTPKELPHPTVKIIGPDTVPFGTVTYYTLVSQNAVRAEWGIGGFANNERFVINLPSPSHQIYVEPTSAERVGDVFVIAVTVYNKNGDTATATKQFTIVANE